MDHFYLTNCKMRIEFLSQQNLNQNQFKIAILKHDYGYSFVSKIFIFLPCQMQKVNNHSYLITL